MRQSRKRWLFYLWPLVIVLALALTLAASSKTTMSLDLTRNHRHSLSDASLKLLALLEGPVSIICYLRADLETRQRVLSFVTRYQRAYSELEFRFLDVVAVSSEIEKGQIKEGELLVNYRGRQERVSELTESALSNALARLAGGEAPWIAFAAGHGERLLDGSANHHLGNFGDTLIDRGFKALPLDLAGTVGIPNNTMLLVIANPAINYPARVRDRISKYLSNGGNLLWLAEPQSLDGNRFIGEQFNLRLVPGTIIDPAAQALGVKNAALTVISSYQKTAIFADFNLRTLFPYATAVSVDDHDDWSHHTILNTGKGAWNEIGPIEDQVARDAAGEDSRIFSLGALFERQLATKTRPQRVAVVGDADFLSNTWIDNGGNRQLGLRLVEWLATRDELIDIPMIETPDNQLTLSQWQAGTIAIVFLVVLPLLLVSNGVRLWWRQRHA
ncbi:MAG: GldG family protein [Pseudomonadota bacterium]